MAKTLKIGVIGYGNRMRGLLRMVERFNANTRIAAVADPHFQDIRASLESEGKKAHDCPYFASADDMLDSADIDAVMVGTRCSLHAEMAAKVLAKGLPLYLEKPVSPHELLQRVDRLLKKGK